jgi:hypothetical protein
MKDEFGNNREASPSPKLKDIGNLVIENYFDSTKCFRLYKRRRVIVQVYNSNNNESYFYNIKSPKEKMSKINFMHGDIIRIFPDFTDRCTPVTYSVGFPKNWVHSFDIPAYSNIKKRNNKAIDETFQIVFKAPLGFPEPDFDKESIGNDQNEKKKLFISGDHPIWWIEIIPPTDKEAFIKYFEDATKPKNIEVGEDDQDTTS